MSPAADVVVVGAGLAGAACARALVERGVRVEVLERGRVVGGRLATRRLGDRPCDLGASYLTARDPAFAQVVAGWEERGLARPWTDRLHVRDEGVVREGASGPVRWAAPAGLRVLVADLLEGVPVRVEQRVVRVEAGPRFDGRSARAVVLAMPDPQAAALLDASLATARAEVEGRAWDPVLALAATFERRRWEFDGLFVNDDPTLAFVADDGRRRGDGAPVLVAHSTPAFARAHLHAPGDAAPAMVAALRAVTGADAPASTFVHRWSLARPTSSRAAPFFLGPDGPEGVGLCGDGWGEPRAETAWRSGHALGAALAARLG